MLKAPRAGPFVPSITRNPTCEPKLLWKRSYLSISHIHKCVFLFQSAYYQGKFPFSAPLTISIAAQNISCFQNLHTFWFHFLHVMWEFWGEKNEDYKWVRDRVEFGVWVASLSTCCRNLLPSEMEEDHKPREPRRRTTSWVR